MSDNKHMIYFYFIMLTMSMLLAYIVDLNGQFHFAKLNCPWISNAFCFTILSGILTGTVVALTTEVRQYWLHKRQVQNMLYQNSVEIYAFLSAQKACIEYYINHVTEPIPENIGNGHFQQAIFVRIGYLRSLDYSPFFKKDIIGNAWRNFSTDLNAIEITTRNLEELQISWNKTRISFLEKENANFQVSAASFFMMEILKEKYKELQQSLIVIDSFCCNFEKINNMHFTWTESKKISNKISERIKENPYYRPDKE